MTINEVLRQGQFDIDRLIRADNRCVHSLESVHGKRLRKDMKDSGAPERHDNPNKRRKPCSDEDHLNKLDPIMLEPVRKDPFLFIRPNGTLVAYNVESLVDYLLATGEFYDPETRLPFSDSDLKTIDLYANKAGLTKKSVYEAKVNAAQLFADVRFRRDALVGWCLIRCCVQ